MNTTKCIVFTRHKLTDEQIEAIGRMLPGCEQIDASHLACLDLSTSDAAAEVYDKLKDMATPHIGQCHIFGVMPAMLRHHIFLDMIGATLRGDFAAPVPVWEAVNSQRSPEGGKPTFHFEEWVQTGMFDF